MTSIHHVQLPPTRPPLYTAPDSVAEAIELLTDQSVPSRAIAGGTDLIVELDRASHSGVKRLVDLGRIPGLADISETSDHIRLGAMVTHNQVVASDAVVASALPLAQASLEVGSAQLRNRATVAGNVITASPANDTISALVALGAYVEVTSATGVRTELVSSFITGFRTTSLLPGELVTAIVVPKMASSARGVFVKLGLRKAQAISVVHLTVVIDSDGGRVASATAALGSVAPTIIEVPGFVDALVGRELDSDSIAGAAAACADAATPIDDLRATADYRSSLVGEMITRALTAIAVGRHRDGWPHDVPLLWGSDFDGCFGEKAALSADTSTEISTIVNGQALSASSATGITLLDWLRDELGITGVKEGCAEGECGACTVDLDGASVMSCLVPAAAVDGAEITTVEGLAAGDQLHPIQQSFINTAAVQCGFCTPGLLMASAKLIEETGQPSVDQVKQGLAGNLCRCTGYYSIEAAVSEAAVAIESGGRR